MGASTGAAYAVANPGVTDVKITQQSGTCTGVVKDATGETVIGASVVVKGTTNGTITGLDGDFSLSNVKKGDIIQISFVGYQTQEANVQGKNFIQITLQEETKSLDEVVVVASNPGRTEAGARGIDEYLKAMPIPANDIQHVQDGSWVDTRDSSSDPQWHHWKLPFSIWKGQFAVFNKVNGTNLAPNRCNVDDCSRNCCRRMYAGSWRTGSDGKTCRETSS